MFNKNVQIFHDLNKKSWKFWLELVLPTRLGFAQLQFIFVYFLNGPIYFTEQKFTPGNM